MKTNYNDEDTQLQNEEEKTIIEDNKKDSNEKNECNGQDADNTGEAAEQPADEAAEQPGNKAEAGAQEGENAAEKPEEETSKSKWEKAAGGAGLGAGLGVGLGSVAAVTMGMQDAHHMEHPISPDPQHPSWSDGQIPIATSVNDDMTQHEAFAAARAEVGPGGAFEWHGNVYNTYTAEEWAAMSREEQLAFNDHFTWNQGDEQAGHSNSGHSYTAHNDILVDPDDPMLHPAKNPDIAANPSGEDDDINVISVDHSSDNNLVAETQTHEPGGDDILVSPTEPEIEILGVVHDTDAGTNVGGMLVDGQEVLVVDLDGDMTFDVMASDINGNGNFEHNEIVDIHDQGLTVSDMGGYINPTDDLMASNDAPDYSSDPIYEG